MSKVNLIRIDFRLVHGQVVVQWSKIAEAKKIIVIDDEVSKNDLLKSIYKTAAPPGTKVIIYSIEKSVIKWNEKQFGEGNAIIMFKDIKTCYRAYKAGIPVPKLQLGNAPKSDGKVALGNEVYVSKEEIELLKEMADNGTEISIQTVPSIKAITFKNALAKL